MEKENSPKKTTLYIAIAAAVVVVGGVIFFILSRHTQKLNQPTDNAANHNQVSSSQDSDNDGIPDVAEKTLSTDPYSADTDGDGIPDKTDKDPAFAQNSIANTSQTEGFKIKEALVENNVDSVTKKIADDHLEIALTNTAGKDLTNFEIYYTITDSTTGQKEGYYKKLTGFVLLAGATKSIHFDQTKTELSSMPADHFGENINSIYRTTNNAKVFDITLSTPGYKIVETKVNKDPGGAEKND